MNYNKYLNITRLPIFEAIFLKLNRIKNSQLICVIEITSILAHAKTQLSQAVKSYSFNVIKNEVLQLAHA